MRNYDVYGVVLGSEYVFDNPLPLVLESSATPDVAFFCTSEAVSGADWGDAKVVDAQGHRADGLPDFVFARFASHDAVRIADVMDFHVFDDRIVCHLRDDGHRFLVEIALFGMVFSLWLERRGTPTLHSSVATVGGSAVGFLGVKGGGKTSTLAAMLVRGHALLADDLLALRVLQVDIMAERGFPSLRLWPAQAARFVDDWERLPFVRPDTTKVRATVGDGHHVGRFAEHAAPLRRLYLPERSETVERISLERLRPDLAVMALLRHSFLPHEVQRFGWQPRRLTVLADLAGRVPVLRLRYPSGFDRLPALVERIEADLQGALTPSSSDGTHPPPAG